MDESLSSPLGGRSEANYLCPLPVFALPAAETQHGAVFGTPRNAMALSHCVPSSHAPSPSDHSPPKRRGSGSPPASATQRQTDFSISPLQDGGSLFAPRIGEALANAHFLELEAAPAGERRGKCGCKNSQCIQLYCKCFRGQNFCLDCDCTGCLNLPDSNPRTAALHTLYAQNSLTFNARAASPLSASAHTANDSAARPSAQKRCNCRHSRCRQKYCECFLQGAGCGAQCTCLGCLNDERPRLDATRAARPHAARDALLDKLRAIRAAKFGRAE